MNDKINYYWYLPKENIKLNIYSKPNIFRRFFVWLLLGVKFKVEYSE